MLIEDVLITDLDIINTVGGNVMHAIKTSSVGYAGFGEAYFSQIEFGAIKAWKRHSQMTLNLVVPVGMVKFVLFDDRKGLSGNFQEVTLSKDNYCRLTVPPKIWVGFQGLSRDETILMNIANIEHSVLEVDRMAIDKIKYNWRKK